jgi:hypothetical protein
LQFNLAGPADEEDNTYSGTQMTNAARYVTVLRDLAGALDNNGLSDVGFVGPDLAYT